MLRLLIHDRIFKVGSNVKGDLTRLKKQYTQLATQKAFSVIELKDYVAKRGLIGRKDTASLASLCERVLGAYLPKEDDTRLSNDWEVSPLPQQLKNYAALDVHASRLIFARASEVLPMREVAHDTAAATRVAVIVDIGGEVSAYGKVATNPPKTISGIRVNVPTKSRIAIEIDEVVLPTAAAILHLHPRTASSKTKAGAFTLGELHSASPGSTFLAVMPVSHVVFDYRSMVSHLSFR